MQTGTPDVAIIGAGIIGASIAWRLAQAGAEVTVLDSGTLGGEASWAGAGMLAPGGEFIARSPWSDFALESLRLYPAFIKELRGESGLDIDYRACGAVDEHAPGSRDGVRRYRPGALGTGWRGIEPPALLRSVTRFLFYHTH